MKFYPSYAAFTFPFVITGIAFKQLAGFYAKAGTPVPVLNVVSVVLTVIAAVLTVYTLIRYVAAICKSFSSSLPQCESDIGRYK